MNFLPNPNENKPKETKDDKKRNGLISQTTSNINRILGNASLSLYGTDRTSDVDALNNKFQNILNQGIEDITKPGEGEVSSFLSKLYSNDRKINATNQLLSNQFLSISGDEYSTMQSFIYEAYRNKLLEQSDLHEVASSLIELSEAINITRDAIISADIVDGRMNRDLNFDNIDPSVIDTSIPIVEKMEEKFELQDKIKNFIVPKALEYGEYYAYCIPYNKIFEDFLKQRDMEYMRRPGDNQKALYSEKTLLDDLEKLDMVTESSNVVSKTRAYNDGNNKSASTSFYDSLYNTYMEDSRKEAAAKGIPISIVNEAAKKSEFISDLKNMLGNISISNEAVPLPVLEEGFYSINEFITEKEGVSSQQITPKKTFFDQMMGDQGVTITNGNSNKEEDILKGIDIKDCYVKLIEPTRMVPLEIMDQPIGYYYVVDEDITPLSGLISSTLYYSKFDEKRKEQNIIDSIADKIVQNFDKKFLRDNMKFKRLIVEALNYYNLNEKKLKFQFIPVEYIKVFKVDKDENGHGQSMIRKSLFYAKLYLMILLFKIMSILLYSNDQKVNYIKVSGIDKNIANKVQEIARIKQSRQINMFDLFSYTTLINKVGNGNEMYVPTGRNGERPIETEILSGQDIQLNSDLLEMLKNAYIVGTGVPAAIINYLNEPEFAKIAEQNHSKFSARVVNYQLDFNPAITELYKMIMRSSTNIDENVIENFTFKLRPPQTSRSNVKSEAINAFQTLSDFIAGLMFDDPNESTDPNIKVVLKQFKKIFAKDQLPMLDFDRLEALVKEAEINAKKEKLEPNPTNGDNGEDGLDPSGLDF